ncbi:hypothetical protein ACFWSO_37615, partial [Streptomyces sp. NPDC058572]
ASLRTSRAHRTSSHRRDLLTYKITLTLKSPWPGTTTEESAGIEALKRENAELKRVNEILKAAAGFFADELDRPQRRS